MKKVKLTTGMLLMLLITLGAWSCNDNKNEHNNEDGHHSEHMEESGHDHSKMNKENMKPVDKMSGMNKNSGTASSIISDYLELKNALVSDDNGEAKIAGEKLMASLGDLDQRDFNPDQQQELKDILEDATEHAEHISESPLEHQREHFDVLSKDVIDLIAITGTEKTLYQDFCPMYNNKKGAQWLSENKEIKNPFYGGKMMTCGRVQKQIN